MSFDQPSDAATDNTENQQEVRLNAMLKAIVLQRDAANNQTAKAMSDTAVAESQLLRVTQQAEARRARNVELVAANAILSKRVIQLEENQASLHESIRTYEALLEDLRLDAPTSTDSTRTAAPTFN